MPAAVTRAKKTSPSGEDMPDRSVASAPMYALGRADVKYSPPSPPAPHFVVPVDMAVVLQRLQPLKGEEHFLMPKSKSMETLLGLTAKHYDGAGGAGGSNLPGQSRQMRISPTKRIPPNSHLLAARTRADASTIVPETAAAAPTHTSLVHHLKATGPLPGLSLIRWKSGRDAARQRWPSAIFPSELPLGRDQVHVLRKWLLDSISSFDLQEAEDFREHAEAERGASPLLANSAHINLAQPQQAQDDDKNLERRAKRATALLDIYGAAVHEIVRQEKTVCVDRSALLSEIWIAVSSMVGAVLDSVGAITPLPHVRRPP